MCYSGGEDQEGDYKLILIGKKGIAQVISPLCEGFNSQHQLFSLHLQALVVMIFLTIYLRYLNSLSARYDLPKNSIMLLEPMFQKLAL